MNTADKRFKKKLYRILDRHGVFTNQPFIQKQYKESIYKDILNLIKEVNKNEDNK